VLVPFGAGREEWPALQLAAWLARAHRLPLRLLGAEPVVVPPGADGILAQDGAAIVASLPRDGADATRRRLLEHARVPVLLVHGGLRPGGLAPERSLTRFTWSIGSDPDLPRSNRSS
jgi:hypothetical protein